MSAKAYCFQFDNVEVSSSAFSVLQGGKRLDLEPKAIRVLIHLLRHRERVVPKEELFQEVWEATAVTDNALTRIIAQLRRELGDDSRSPRYIETVPTVGYRFIAEVSETLIEAQVPSAPSPRRSRLPIVAAASLAAIAACWFLYPRTVAPKFSADAVLKQITTNSGVDARPSFGPDGLSFVYSSNQNGQFEIYRRSLSANGQSVPVTANGKQNVHPAWSPDGKWIAYHSAGDHGIWIVPAAGGEPKRVAPFGSAPSWSPDSKLVVFTSAEPFSLVPFDPGGTGNLWTAEIHGSGLRQITNAGAPQGRHVSPAWSHDGKRIVFVSLQRDSGIYVLDLATGQSTQVMKTGKDIPRQEGTYVSRAWDPVFGPGDEMIYFSAAGQKGQYSIWSMPAGGGVPRRLHTSSADTPTGLSIAPDGSRLLFTRARNVSQLWTVDESGKTTPLFQQEVLRASLPSYSPDGKWLAFSVELQGRNRNIWVMPAEGGQAAPVSDDDRTIEGGVVWAPSGELHYSKVVDAETEFHAFDPNTRKTQLIHKRGNAGIARPVLMPNAKDILAACSSPLNVCLLPLSGAPTRQLTFERTGAAFHTTDRSGQWITYQAQHAGTDQIGVIRSDGTQSKLLTNDSAWNWASGFSDDGRRIAFASFHQGVWNLWWINRETGERKQLTHETAFGSFVRSPVWRPGTEKLTYESFQVKGNIFSLDLR